MFKKLLIHTRRSIKLIILISLAVLLILACIASFYKISYSVTINGEMVGYTDNKSKLQTEINDYIEKGESENTAFVQVDSLPEYKVCLLKRDVQASDEDIFNIIKSAGTTYYRYYSINENDEEKLYVANFTEAEDIINQLKEKNSKNMDNITISEKYETQMQDFTTVEDAVSNLYVQKPQVTVAKNKTTSVGSVNTATTIAGGKVSLGISLARPVSGIISSRFGARSSIRSSAHTGLDIATSTGTPVLAAASGTVTFSGRKGSYGNLLVITHSNGVQTYYGHCSKLYVSAGTTVTQGQTVAAVGSTGNSTGPHLHFEVRVNGVAYNPQNYLY
ncbi:MAG: hypothetical protein BHW00_00265 [Clostridium sp. 26_22]|nr:MAG: hypothetical protein BHW00_00265 [Clostridium sp. 26_22]